MTYHWYEGLGSLTRDGLRAVLAIDQSPFRRLELPRVIRLWIAQGASPQAPERGELELRAFAASVSGLLGGEPRAHFGKAFPLARNGRSQNLEAPRSSGHSDRQATENTAIF